MSNLKKFFAALVIASTDISCSQASEFAGPYAGFNMGKDWSDASGVVNTASHRTTFPGLRRLSQKGTQANAPAFLALTIQALIKLNCFASYLLRQPLRAGYGYDVKQFMIGAEVFADFHHGSTTYKDGGVDLKVGMPFTRSCLTHV